MKKKTINNILMIKLTQSIYSGLIQRNWIQIVKMKLNFNDTQSFHEYSITIMEVYRSI